MGYACTAMTNGSGAGRCRGDAIPGDPDNFCPRHANERDMGKTVAKVGLPDIVVWRQNLDPDVVEELVALGVPRAEVDFAARDAAYAAEAKRLGRQADKFRSNVPDAGTPVFGKNGVQLVYVGKLFEELLDVYQLVEVEIQPRRRGGDVLVVTFDQEGEPSPSQLAGGVVDIVHRLNGQPVWAHIWANPAKVDETLGRRVVDNTVNLSGGTTDAGERELCLAGGLWEVKEL